MRPNYRTRPAHESFLNRSRILPENQLPRTSRTHIRHASEHNPGIPVQQFPAEYFNQLRNRHRNLL
jgi:hypothetical protein